MQSNQNRTLAHSTNSSTLADILERVLDKGIVIAGDIKVKLCDIELLTIQIRLVVCSVDKAVEMGIDWWAREPAFSRHAALPVAAAAVASPGSSGLDAVFPPGA